MVCSVWKVVRDVVWGYMRQWCRENSENFLRLNLQDVMINFAWNREVIQELRLHQFYLLDWLDSDTVESLTHFLYGRFFSLCFFPHTEIRETTWCVKYLSLYIIYRMTEFSRSSDSSTITNKLLDTPLVPLNLQLKIISSLICPLSCTKPSRVPSYIFQRWVKMCSTWVAPLWMLI